MVDSTVLSGPVIEEIQALKDAPGRDIFATGSPQLVHAQERAPAQGGAGQDARLKLARAGGRERVAS